jgi:hypothetical protein
MVNNPVRSLLERADAQRGAKSRAKSACAPGFVKAMAPFGPMPADNAAGNRSVLSPLLLLHNPIEA